MPPKKKKKKPLITVNPVKISENSSKKQLKNTFIISSMAAVIIIALALATAKIRSTPSAENNIIKSATSEDVITIINPETNETSEIKIHPASAVKSTSNIQPAENTPVPESKNLFKKAEKKTEIPKINLKEAKQLFDSQKALFIDTRNIHSYNSGHIKGAVPIQVNAFPDIFEKYKNKMRDKVLVTYCNGIGCHISDKVAYNLFDKGYRQIAIFFGGWNEWVKAGYPVESSD
ncbi:MAG: rhodanese-like domain-containing protein [Candidatus Goldiibacteriota bacterium]